MFSTLEHHAILKRTSFQIENVDLSIVNAIRRIILSEIPNIAVAFDAYNQDLNDVKFIHNTTSLHNEFIGHRLSLIPIYLSQADINTYRPEQYKFVIDEHNTSNTLQQVTTDDIQVYDEEGNPVSSTITKKMFPKDPVTKDPILITVLKPNLYNKENGEHLHVEFRARRGMARQNAGWCPVSLCSYTFVVDEKKAKQELASKLDGVTDKTEKETIKRVFDTLDKQRYYYVNDFNEPSKFKFVIESECALKPIELFTEALNILESKMKSVVEDAGKFTVHAINREANFYAITVMNEDHTLGNVIQSMIYNHFVRGSKRVEYVGYNMPHPLEAQIIIKIKFNKDETPAEFLQELFEVAQQDIRNVRKAWSDASQSEQIDMAQDAQDEDVVVKKPKSKSKSIRKVEHSGDEEQVPKPKLKSTRKIITEIEEHGEEQMTKTKPKPKRKVITVG